MPKASYIQNSFTAGELSPLLEGRTDLDKYKSGCQILENFIPSVSGSVTKRPGTRFVSESKNAGQKVWLIPFVFNSGDAYILEFGNNYIRFYTNNGVVLSGGSPYEVVSPYGLAELQYLQYTQSGDILYLAHPDIAPRKLSRSAPTSWALSAIDFDWYPFLTENIDETSTLQASGTVGNITITSSAGIFTASNSSTAVGAHIKFREVTGSKHPQWTAGETGIGQNTLRVYQGNVYTSLTSTGTAGNRPPIHETGTESDGSINWTYSHSGEGYAKITGYISANTVAAEVVKSLPLSCVTGPTFRWSWGAWDGYNGYPKHVTFFEDRLLWAGTLLNPQTIWGSKSGDYENHRSGTDDDMAYRYTINSDQVNAIEWLSAGQVLLIGTSGGEFVMSASTLSEAITPTNVRVLRIGSRGSRSGVKPIRIGGKVLFVQKSGKKVRELEYVWDTNDYVSFDLNVMADHITKYNPGAGFTGVFDEASYQQEPDQLIWYRRFDNQLACLTYERPENVIAWHRHAIGGSYNGGHAEVMSIATIPHPDENQDQLWMVVRRTINGVNKTYIEYMEKKWGNYDVVTSELEDAFFVDCGLTYDGAAATTISGLGHLEGETVSILADGEAHADKVVTSGAITLDLSAEVVQVGLAFTSTLQTMRIDAGAADGTAQGKTKRITDATVRVYETGPGLWFGPTTSNMEQISFDSGSLFSGDKGPLSWPGGYDQDARVTIQHRLPLPCSIIALMPQLVTQDR